MIPQCEYIYCRQPLAVEAEYCHHCGTPRAVGKRPLPNVDHGLDFIIDMHQILPAQSNALQIQLGQMKGLRIKKALMQSVPSKVRSIFNNELLRGLHNQYPDLFSISQFMDPRHPFARRKIRKYAAEGTRVIKLLPSLGFRPDRKRWDRFWGQMEALGLTAMVHTGFMTARHKHEEKANKRYLNSNYCNPLYFDTVARKFPDLQIILCHTGGALWYEEACQMINQHSNVWGDISGFGHFALDRILRLEVPLDWRKIFWGNDAHPELYNVNLRLTLSKLNNAGRSDLIPYVLRDNAETFMNRYIG